MSIEKNKREKINWKHTIKNSVYMIGLIVRACPGVFILGIIFSIWQSVNGFFSGIYIYQYALNALQEGKDLKSILVILLFILLFSVGFWVFKCVSDCYLELKYPKVEAYIQKLLQKKAAEVDLICYEKPAFYDAYVKAAGETTDRAYKVMNTVLDLIYAIVDVAAVGTLMITIDPIFLVFALIPLACTMLIGRKRNKVYFDYRMRNQEVGRQRDYVRRTFYLKDFSKEMRLTQMWKVMFNRMHNSIAEMKEIVDEYGYRIMFYRYLFDLAFDVAVDTGAAILAVYKTLVAKTMLLGDCYVVIRSLSYVAGGLNWLGDTLLKLDEHSLYVDKLREFLDYEVHIAEDPSAPEVSEFQSLELCDMSFRYEGQSAPALSKVSLTINAGERIAIVGHNGAGKTTLIKLLQRLYDPEEGEILLNGRNIKQYRLSSYRHLFGTVFQDYQLFAATIAENVMLRGEITDADREVVKQALRKTGVYDKVQTLPGTVDCMVTREFDKNGAVFSGGEAQKISIARILTGDCRIVIMDEPTSALDPIAEQEMYRNMFEACEGKTVIFISHRLSSAVMADRVYMFENGEIIEQGTHEELLAFQGKYADMWYKQANSYADTEEVKTEEAPVQSGCRDSREVTA